MTSPIVPVPYTRKDPDILVVEIVFENLQDVADWLVSELPSSYSVYVQTSMGGMITFGEEVNGQMQGKVVRPGNYLVKDSNGKIFSLDVDTLNSFYDLAP